MQTKVDHFQGASFCMHQLSLEDHRHKQTSFTVIHDSRARYSAFSKTQR